MTYKCVRLFFGYTVILSNIQENPHGFYGLIQTTDISFPRNREGSIKPLKTLWRSTMGVQSPVHSLASERADCEPIDLSVDQLYYALII